MSQDASLVMGCDHVSVLVSDLDRAAYFYTQVLGLMTMPRPSLGFDGLWLSLNDGVTLHLLVLPNPDHQRVAPLHAGRDRHIALRVRCLDEAETRLRLANIVYTRSLSGRASLFCRDPDGNGVELMLV